jgi:hypothetical protein
MRYSTDTIEIETEIEKFGHMVLNIFNIKQNQTNTPLPLFFVDLKPSKNNKDIYHIETLNYTKVKFEPPRTKINTTQCSKCQRYGHTQAYCYYSPRRVKCAGSHLTKHCVVYKGLQKRTFPLLRNKQEEKNRKSYRKNKPNQTYLMQLLSNLNKINSRLLARKPNNKYHASSICNCH